MENENPISKDQMKLYETMRTLYETAGRVASERDFMKNRLDVYMTEPKRKDTEEFIKLQDHVFQVVVELAKDIESHLNAS